MYEDRKKRAIFSARPAAFVSETLECHARLGTSPYTRRVGMIQKGGSCQVLGFLSQVENGVVLACDTDPLIILLSAGEW